MDADQGDGQGASNYSRTLQAEALVDFADDVRRGGGHRQGVPARVTSTPTPWRTRWRSCTTRAGYIDLGSDAGRRGHLPVRRSCVGSLDHVLASDGGVRRRRRRRRLEHQLGRVGRAGVQPLQLQRDELLRRVAVPVQRSRPADRRCRPAASNRRSVDARRWPNTTYGTAPKVDVTVTSDPAATGTGAGQEGTTTARVRNADQRCGVDQARPVRAQAGRAHADGELPRRRDVAASSTTGDASTVAKVDADDVSESVTPAKVVVKKTKAKVTVTVVARTSSTPDRHGCIVTQWRPRCWRPAPAPNGRVTLTLPVFKTTGNKTIRIALRR